MNDIKRILDEALEEEGLNEGVIDKDKRRTIYELMCCLAFNGVTELDERLRKLESIADHRPVN